MLYLKGLNEFTLGSLPFLVASGNGDLELKLGDKTHIESIPENNRLNPVNSIALFASSASHATFATERSPRMLFLNKTKPTHCVNLTSVSGFPPSNFWDG